MKNEEPANDVPAPVGAHLITLFLCGDVMTGRGIDQVFPHPGDPVLHEPYVKDARVYVKLAEKANGPIPGPVSHPYIWGDALVDLERVAPDLRIINLETSITTSNDYWKGKGIHYRMRPENISCITAAKIDLCVLANNHILDWGYAGLAETLETLKKANVRSVGAGGSMAEAEAPAVMEAGQDKRVIVFSIGSPSSGIPLDWAASEKRAGVNLLKCPHGKTVRGIESKVKEIKQQGDLVIASIHWGDNWGYGIPPAQIELAHDLIDHAGVDIIHGHSSHHVKGLEIYRSKPILYGCGDFLNDYEGISGYDELRDDLGLMYFVTMNSLTGAIDRLRMTPTRIKSFRIKRASRSESVWLRDILIREGRPFGTRVDLDEHNMLTLRWG